MSMRDCINSAIAEGLIDKTRGDEAKEIFEEIEVGLRASADGIDASATAATRTLETMKREKSRKRWQQFKQLSAEREKEAGIKAASDSGEAAIAAIESDGKESPFTSAKQQRDVVHGRAHQLFADALSNFRRTIFGNTRDKATLADMVREAFGENTNNPNARAFAQAWYDTAEYLRVEFNKAGGSLAKLERWGMPQMHSDVKVRSVTFEVWRDFILPKLDRTRTIDHFTGQPFSDAQLEVALRGTYDSIRTDGMSRLNPSGNVTAKSRGNSRLDHRFLHFKKADDWMAYQARFGAGDDAYSSMMAHIDRMARDIGEMRALGPNPAKTVRFMQSLLKKEAATLEGSDGAADKLRNKLGRDQNTLKNTYDQYTGTANAPADGRVSSTLRDIRGILTAAQLGSAAITAISDLSFGRLAAKTSGLPAAKVLARHLKLLSPHVSADQKLAVKLGLIADNWTRVASAQMRYVGEISGTETVQRISDGILRASGLSPWTQAGRWAFGMEFMSTLADHSGKAFNELPEPLRKTMTSYRISADAWDNIRATSHFEPEKGGFIRPSDIADEELATRVMAMIQQETEFAVPTTSLRGRAALTGNVQPGTIPGELLRSGLMYKNFAVTMYYTHIQRMASQQGKWNKAKYAANLFGGATLMGGLAMQLKEISKGKDPMPMFNEDGTPSAAFWTGAMLQGGGLGIAGDFLFSDVNRFGDGLATTIGGPVVGLANDVRKLTQGNISKLMQGDDTSIGRDISRMLRLYTPGTSLWYSRLALERVMWDNLDALVDPNAAGRFKRAERRQLKERGNEYFFPRGQLTPDRAPQFNLTR